MLSFTSCIHPFPTPILRLAGWLLRRIRGRKVREVSIETRVGTRGKWNAVEPVFTVEMTDRLNSPFDSSKGRRGGSASVEGGGEGEGSGECR